MHHDHDHWHHHHHHPRDDLHTSAPNGLDTPCETANAHYFDMMAAHNYDARPEAQRRAEQIGRAMIDTGLFKPGVTTVMDYACGAGLLSRVLAAEDPKSIVGVDISPAMVDRYNQVVSDHGIPPEEMRAICVLPHERLQGLTFDVIVCASSYHHFPSIDEATALLTAHLNPGGSLLVSDLVHGEAANGIFPENLHHIVAHRGGFAEEDIRSAFEKAGLNKFSFEVIARVRHDGHPVDLFLARGDK